MSVMQLQMSLPAMLRQKYRWKLQLPLIRRHLPRLRLRLLSRSLHPQKLPLPNHSPHRLLLRFPMLIVTLLSAERSPVCRKRSSPSWKRTVRSPTRCEEMLRTMFIMTLWSTGSRASTNELNNNYKKRDTFINVSRFLCSYLIFTQRPSRQSQSP